MDRKFDIKFYLAIVVLVLANITVYKSIFFSPEPSQILPGEFPAKISKWIAEDVTYDEDVLRVLASDKIIYKTYYRKGGPPVTLFLSYYDSLEKADLSHSPVVCSTGQGWAITQRMIQEIPLDPAGTEWIKVNKLIQNRGDATLITVFWYQSTDTAFHNRGLQKISLFFDKLMGRSERNAFVRITASVPPVESVEKTSAEINDFVRVLYPELRRFFL